MISVYIGFCKRLDFTQSVLYELIHVVLVVAIPLCMYTHAFLGKGQLKPLNYEKLFVFTILIIIHNPKFNMGYLKSI